MKGCTIFLLRAGERYCLRVSLRDDPQTKFFIRKIVVERQRHDDASNGKLHILEQKINETACEVVAVISSPEISSGRKLHVASKNLRVTGVPCTQLNLVILVGTTEAVFHSFNLKHRIYCGVSYPSC